jgi:hypothetical protein
MVPCGWSLGSRPNQLKASLNESTGLIQRYLGYWKYRPNFAPELAWFSGLAET